LKLQNWVLELWSNYEIATDRFFHLRLPAPRPPATPYAGAGHLGGQVPSPRPKPHWPPLDSPPNQLSWRCTAATRAPARHAIAVAERRAESAFSPRFASCPSCSLPSSPSLSLPPIKRAPSPLARPDPLFPIPRPPLKPATPLHAELLPPPPHSTIQAAHDILHLPLTLYNPTPIAQDHPRGHIGRHHCRTPPELRGATIPARSSPNRTLHELGLSPPKLLGPTSPSQRRRRSAAAAQSRRRPPLAVESPAPTTSAPPTTTQG